MFNNNQHIEQMYYNQRVREAWAEPPQLQYHNEAILEDNIRDLE